MRSMDIRATIENMRELHRSGRALLAQIEPLQPGQQRSRLEHQLAGVTRTLSAKIFTFNLWAAELQLGVLQMEADQLWEMPGPEAEATLAGLYELTRMEDTNAEVVHRLEPSWFPVSGSRLRAPLAVLSLVVFGWQSALMRWCGLPAYTAHMRSQLLCNSVVAWLWLAAMVCASRMQLPSELVLAAAAYVVWDVVKSAVAAYQQWHSDDLPQRRRDVQQLGNSVATANGMAAAGGSVASLAGAMAGRLEGTQARAATALSAIERRPV